MRQRDLEFEVNDWVFLKLSPRKSGMRFGKKGKHSPAILDHTESNERLVNWLVS